MVFRLRRDRRLAPSYFRRNVSSSPETNDSDKQPPHRVALIFGQPPGLLAAMPLPQSCGHLALLGVARLGDGWKFRGALPVVYAQLCPCHQVRQRGDTGKVVSLGVISAGRSDDEDEEPDASVGTHDATKFGEQFELLAHRAKYAQGPCCIECRVGQGQHRSRGSNDGVVEQGQGGAACARLGFYQDGAYRPLLSCVGSRPAHACTAVQQCLARREIEVVDEPVQRRRTPAAPTGGRNVVVLPEFYGCLGRPFRDRAEFSRHRVAHGAELGPDACADLGLDVRPDPRPRSGGKAGDVDALDPVDREQRACLANRGLGPCLRRIGGVDHVADDSAIEFESWQSLQHAGRRGVGEHRDRGDDGDGQSGRSGRRHESCDGGRRRHVVEHRNTGAGPLFLGESAGPRVHRRGRRRLGHRRGDPHRGGQRDEARPIQVEGLRDVGTHVVAAAVTRDAENRVRADVLEAAQLLLEDDAVAVATRQRDPRCDAAVEKHPTHQGRREVGTILVLTHQHGIAGRREDGCRGSHVVGIKGGATEVSENERCLHGGRGHFGAGPGDDVVERTGALAHLALPVGSHAAAWPEVHPLRAVLCDYVNGGSRRAMRGHGRARTRGGATVIPPTSVSDGDHSRGAGRATVGRVDPTTREPVVPATSSIASAPARSTVRGCTRRAPRRAGCRADRIRAPPGCDGLRRWRRGSPASPIRRRRSRRRRP